MTTDLRSGTLVGGLRIRELSAKDASEVSRLAHEVGDEAAARLATFEREVGGPGISAWGVFDERTGLAGVGLARQWGRAAHVSALAVAPASRGQGIGGQILDTLTLGLARDRAAVIGAEVPSDALNAAAFLARHGFRAAHPAWSLERGVGNPPPTEDEAAPLSVVPAGEAVPDAVLERFARLAASLDAELDPSAWVVAAVAGGWASLLHAPGPDGGGEGAAGVLVAGEAPEVVSCPLLLADEGPPFRGLTAAVRSLLAEARERGARRLIVPGPARSWEAWTHLLALGFSPARATIRFTRLGHAEVADTRRACLVSWR